MNPKIKHIDLGINYRDDLNKSVFKKIFSYISKQKKHKQKLKEVLHDLKADVVISMFDNDVNLIHNIKDGSKRFWRSTSHDLNVFNMIAMGYGEL